MPHTRAPGFRMQYEMQGEGDPLLLINGLGSDRSEWLFQLPAFGRLFRVVAFDNRGTGGSEAPPGPYSTSQMADDAAALLTHLEIGRAHVLGVSLGGMIAQEVALRHPETTRKKRSAVGSPSSTRKSTGAGTRRRSRRSSEEGWKNRFPRRGTPRSWRRPWGIRRGTGSPPPPRPPRRAPPAGGEGGGRA